jgi:PAS domain S-box-containing protein
VSQSRSLRTPPTRRTLAIRTYIWFGLVLALLLGLVTFAGIAFDRLDEASEQNVHSYRVLDEVERLLTSVIGMQTGYRGFMITGDSSFLEPFRESIPAAARHADGLADLTRNDPDHQRRLAELRVVKEEWLTGFMEPRLAVRAAMDDATVTLAELERSMDAVQGKGYVTRIRGLVDQMRSAEEARLEQREVMTARLRWVTRISLTLGGIFAILVTAALAALAARTSGRLLSANTRLRREIADREEAEQRVSRLSRRHELILNTAADGIWGVNRSGVTTFVNLAAARMTGYGVEELTGSQTHALIHHSYADGSPYPEEQCRIRLAIERGEQAMVADEVFWRVDGSSFPVEYSATPLTEDGEITGAVVVFRDVTERREVERMKDEFVSVVSHELRTPLTSIRGSLGLLGSGMLGTLPERGQRLIEIATDNTDRLVRLVNDILDIEKIDSGRIEMERSAVDAADLVRQAVDTVEAMALKLSVRLEVEPPPARIWADADRIVQVLTNLMSNAIKFSEPDGLVRVGGESVDGQLRISVSDDGRGIPHDMQERIFGRFQQVDASDSRQKGGTGLGLAIARSIVHQHGGTIWVESEPGVGSSFHFTLPLLSEGEPDVPPPLAQASDAPLVLLCDDDESIRNVVGAQLEEEGYRVAAAETGMRAIAIAQLEQPGAILLDLMMPEQDGWETLTRLKADPLTRDIPVIIFSARSPESGDPGDAAEWVTKASDDATLFGALERALSTRVEPARILIVEENPHLADVLTTFFGRSGLEAVHARSCEEALELSAERIPDLLVLDLVMRAGSSVDAVDCLRRDPRLRRVPLVVYSASDLMNEHRARLGKGAELITQEVSAAMGLEQRLTRVVEQLLNNPNRNRDGKKDPDRR